MAINYTRLGQRLGKLCGSLNEINTYRGTTLVGRVSTIQGQYTSVNPDLITDLFNQESAGFTSFSSWVSYLSALCSDVIVAEVNNDKPLTGFSLSSCLDELRRQMVLDSQSFDRCLVTLSSTVIGSAVGDFSIVLTDKDGTGQRQDFLIPDAMLLRVTADEDHGGTMWQEGYTLVGRPASGSDTDHTYADSTHGAGVNTSGTMVDPAVAGIVTDPMFAATTAANVFTSWTVNGTGVSGTNYLQDTQDPRGSPSPTCLKLVATASGLLKIRQLVTLTPNTVYAVHFKVRPTAVVGTSKVSVILTDAAGVTLADDQSSNDTLSSGTVASTTINVWTAGTSGTFVTPSNMPSQVYLEIRMHEAASLTTAPTSGDAADVSHVCLHEVTHLYTGGPAVTLFSGKTAARDNDAYTITAALASGAIGDYLIRGVDRLIGLRNDVRLPTSGSGTIPNSDVS